ncbi:MAG: hypothetical protein JNL68_09745 [Burkholderiales bacterium]|nr:hypothetical protein [Burkholderiales bacterium]
MASWREIIEASSANPLAIVALVVLVIFGLTGFILKTADKTGAGNVAFSIAIGALLVLVVLVFTYFQPPSSINGQVWSVLADETGYHCEGKWSIDRVFECSLTCRAGGELKGNCRSVSAGDKIGISYERSDNESCTWFGEMEGDTLVGSYHCSSTGARKVWSGKRVR